MMCRPFQIQSTCILLSLTFFISVKAQTLFTYGDQAVSKEEFLRAFKKNNSKGKPNEKSYREYFELYSRYKLKVKAAYDLRLDTIPSLLAEIQNFRNQMADAYMNDEGNLNRLVHEAFDRSQKDIHLAEIYVAAPSTAAAADTLKAFQKAGEAYGQLKKGRKFFDVADEFSDDPFAKSNHGDIGFITVFTLPYELENLAYSIPTGGISRIYRGKNGYYIFKNLGIRKAIGKIRAAQILMAFPFNASDAVKADVKIRADSIYQDLIRGSNFGELARKFSGDNLSYQTGGEMPEFGVGRFDPAFEKAAFALAKDGDISPPFMTSFGYHIIKRLSRRTIPTVKNKTALDLLKQQVMSDPRIEYSKRALQGKIYSQVQFKEYPFNQAALWIYTDSFLQNRSIPKFTDLDAQTILFSYGNKKAVVKDWTAYRNSIKNIPSLSRGRSARTLLDQFEQTTCYDYYRSHLENYNADFAYQLNEFKDGNLLFEIMQRQVWDKASADSNGLKAYYDANRNKYWWQSSADVILFTCGNARIADNLKSKIKTQPNLWRRITDSTNGQAQSDSGRFELSQVPPPEQGQMQAGQFSSLLINPADNSLTMAYIVKLYPDRAPRNYRDARGLVVNDYQAFLEENWIRELKKKYPVKLNESVFKLLPK
ncbi:MAG: peptidylprolyl isomerase [Chitinophagales bacterium]